MFRITKTQLFCLLILLISPVAYMETPRLLIQTLYNNAWLAAMATLLPGMLLIYMYSHIIKKSTQPFPLLLNEHLGPVLGRVVAFVFIFFFVLVCSYTLRLFIEFIKMNVLPATPISVFIGVFLFMGFAAIRSGLENIARISELIVMAGLPFSFIIVIISMLNNFHVDRLLPIGYMGYKAFGMATLLTSSILGKMMPVLCLAFFIDKKEDAKATMNSVILTHVTLMILTSLAIIITLGTIPALSYTFPTAYMVRLARIGSFIQNMDIVLIGFWVLGIFAAVTLPWFMACYITQMVFKLRDYRFLAAPSTLIIGVLSIAISRNNIETLLWGMYIIPPLYAFFFIGIPFIVFLITLFKPYPENSPVEPILAPDQDQLHKQGVTG